MDELDKLQADDERQELELFRESQRRSREMTREAVAELASVLEPGQRSLPTGSELFLAAYVVGQAGGITLRPPAAWREQAKRSDPVKLIAAASHVRSRKILLHDGWSKQDCGPLLAFTAEDGKPLALLPLAPGKYEVFSRRDGKLSERITLEVLPGQQAEVTLGLPR